MKIDFNSIEVSKYTDGSVDEATTVAIFADSLRQWVEETHKLQYLCGKMVNAVFDEYKGAYLNIPAVCTFATGKFGVGSVTPENYDAVTAGIKSYLKANSGTKDSGLPFGIIKSKGVCRWVDQDVNVAYPSGS